MTALEILAGLALAVIVILAASVKPFDPRLSKTWKGGDE